MGDYERAPAGTPSAAPAPPLHVRGVVLPAGEHQDLYVVDGRISLTPVPDATLVGEGWIVPGLVDAHCHIGLGPEGAVDREETERQAIADRDAGTLLARDCGVPTDTHWIDDRLDLPRVIRAGRHLARPRRYIRNFGVEIEPGELAAAATEQARRGDGWVKVVADWIERDTGDLAPLWPEEVLTATVAAVHAAGARITVHTFDERAVREAVAAGVDCVEHGTGLDAPTIEAMAAGGVALVPTLINVDSFPSIADRAERFPAYADHMRRLHAGSRQVVRSAVEAGVQVYAGTDAGGSLAHGRVADEVEALTGAGLSAEAALAAASWGAREWLRQPSTLDEGDPADLVVYPTDPRSDVTVLRAPSRVVLRGRVVA